MVHTSTYFYSPFSLICSKKKYSYCDIYPCAKRFALTSFLLIYRIFHLDCTSFIPQVKQHKLNSCCIGCLFKTLLVLRCMHLNFLFSKNLERFSKNSSLGTKSDRDIQFTPNWGKYEVVFAIKKIMGIGDVVCEIRRIKCKKMFENFLNFLNFCLQLFKKLF